MNKPVHFLLAALLGVSLTAFAAGGPGAARIDANYVQKTTLVSELYDNLYVAGTINGLDRNSGMVNLRTETQGDISLQFHPAELRSLKVGDVVVVNLGFSIDDRTISRESCDLLPVKVASC